MQIKREPGYKQPLKKLMAVEKVNDESVKQLIASAERLLAGMSAKVAQERNEKAGSEQTSFKKVNKLMTAAKSSSSQGLDVLDKLISEMQHLPNRRRQKKVQCLRRLEKI